MTNSWYFRSALLLRNHTSARLEGCCYHVTSLIPKQALATAQQSTWAVERAGTGPWAERQHSPRAALGVSACLCQQLLDEFGQNNPFPFPSASWAVKQEQQSNLLLGSALKLMAKVLHMWAGIFQPSRPLEVTTLHGWGSREHVRGLLPLLITAVFQARFALAQPKCMCGFSVAEGYGQQPLAEGQSEQGAERRLAHLRPWEARHRSIRSQLLSTNK